jgi:DNA-binding MarR family transcriptional regulator
VPPQRSRTTAFLLSQLGTLAAAKFADLTREQDLSPSDAGVLRLLGRHPGISQRALADRLGAVPSRVVALVDSLEQRGLVARTRSVVDRRTHELTLSDDGQAALRLLRSAAERHEQAMLGPLSDAERRALGELLATLAAAHGLNPEAHPGYRRPPDQPDTDDKKHRASSC